MNTFLLSVLIVSTSAFAPEVRKTFVHDCNVVGCCNVICRKRLLHLQKPVFPCSFLLDVTLSWLKLVVTLFPIYPKKDACIGGSKANSHFWLFSLVSSGLMNFGWSFERLIWKDTIIQIISHKHHSNLTHRSQSHEQAHLLMLMVAVKHLRRLHQLVPYSYL